MKIRQAQKQDVMGRTMLHSQKSYGDLTMKRFVFIMQHKPTDEQLEAARKMGVEKIIALDPGKPEAQAEGVDYFGTTASLIVPDDPKLNREWFVNRANEIVEAVDGFNQDDIVHVMGQQQL
ncbi:MAG: hypothetical protein ABH826_02950, partial [Patescibacteria group bacterium]